jgi:hypothetical protein
LRLFVCLFELHLISQRIVHYQPLSLNYYLRDRVGNVDGIKELALHRCGIEPGQGFVITARDKAIKLAYGNLVELRCLLAPEMMHEALKLPFSLYSAEVIHQTYIHISIFKI